MPELASTAPVRPEDLRGRPAREGAGPTLPLSYDDLDFDIEVMFGEMSPLIPGQETPAQAGFCRLSRAARDSDPR